MTPKTKLLVLTNPVNYTGQFFPVKEICELAHSKGVEVLVDGAQSLAHTDYRIPDLGCDYFAASLHKWLLAPLGTGLLYIKRDKIEKVRSLLPGTNFDEERNPREIFRFDGVGTQSFAAALGITEAVEFHNGIGGKRKEARFRYLTKYWVDQVRSLPNIKFHTSFEPGMSCGLVTFEIEGISSPDLARHLFREHFILVQNVQSRRANDIRGVRVTPNIYTTLNELDFFCEKIEHIARKGLPS